LLWVTPTVATMPHWFTKSIRLFSHRILGVTVGLFHTRRVTANAPVSLF
jgi:hypothetical protein